MHNHDTSKDDILEAIFEIVDRFQHYVKKEIKEWKENKENAKPVNSLGLDSKVEKTNLNEEKGKEDYLNEKESTDPRVTRFQNAMKEIMGSDANNNVKEIAKTFYENPSSSMKMLQSVMLESMREDANKLIVMTEQNVNMFKEVRNTISMTNPKALDWISTLNNTIQNEQDKIKIAENILREAGGNVKENSTSQIDSLRVSSSVEKGVDTERILNKLDEVEIENGKNIIMKYIEKKNDILEPYKDMLSENIENINIDNETNNMSVRLKHERFDSWMIITLNPNEQTIKLVEEGIGESKGSWVSEFTNIETINLNQLNENAIDANAIGENYIMKYIEKNDDILAEYKERFKERLEHVFVNEDTNEMSVTLKHEHFDRFMNITYNPTQQTIKLVKEDFGQGKQGEDKWTPEFTKIDEINVNELDKKNEKENENKRDKEQEIQRDFGLER
jgi:hypothetical protein